MTRTLAAVVLLIGCSPDTTVPIPSGAGGGVASSTGGGDEATGGGVASGTGGGVASGTGGGVASGTGGGTTSGTGGGTGSTLCAMTANTAPTGVVVGTCAMLTRDTTSCRGARMAAGFTGYWLEYSCNVTLSKVTTNGAQFVHATTQDLPDYPSNFYPTTDPCHDNYTPAMPNPNHIAAQNVGLDIPVMPTETATDQGLGIVGLAMNGVVIYNNEAAPGDDIFLEARSFDRCQAHPTMRSQYHYHVEPTSISHDDSAFIGVLRDGYPIYGRKDEDGTMPVLGASGGHVGPTRHSSTPVFHYHVNGQTSTAATTAGQTQWFLTTGTYQGLPGTCTGCGAPP